MNICKHLFSNVGVSSF